MQVGSRRQSAYTFLQSTWITLLLLLIWRSGLAKVHARQSIAFVHVVAGVFDDRILGGELYSALVVSGVTVRGAELGVNLAGPFLEWFPDNGLHCRNAGANLVLRQFDINV